MTGLVAGLSRNKQRVAVLTDYGYTVFDIKEGEAFIGDEIIGNLDEHGSEELTNQTTKQKLYVYIEAIHATKSNAESLLSRI